MTIAGLSASGRASLLDRQAFFKGVRQGPFPGKLTAGQVAGLDAVLDEWERRGLTDLRWLADMLATAKWETAHTMQPIREAGGAAYLKRMYDPQGSRSALAKRNGNTAPGDGVRYCGRGYVQLTWKNNYAAMTKLLRSAGINVDLVKDPDHALQPDIAAFILFEGMIRGSFTGKKLADYFNARTTDWINARRIINGTDKASEIAAIAKQFYADLTKAAQAQPAFLVSQEVDPDDTEANPEDDAEIEPSASDVEPAPIDPDVVGDPELFAVQKRLKGRHYSPGISSGRWGGMTAGAISGFANDAHLTIGDLRSTEEFHEVQEVIKAALTEWEAADLYRPVTEERAAADPETVATVAPEAVPVRRNFLTSAWAAVVTFLTAVWTAVSGYVKSAWDFFADHKDDLPEDSSGLVGTAWSYVQAVPTGVWLLAAAVVLGVLALDARSGLKKITASVQTGDRQ